VDRAAPHKSRMRSDAKSQRLCLSCYTKKPCPKISHVTIVISVASRVAYSKFLMLRVNWSIYIATKPAFWGIDRIGDIRVLDCRLVELGDT
jgi:hypothetical protein